jgi:hypothetical protein
MSKNSGATTINKTTLIETTITITTFYKTFINESFSITALSNKCSYAVSNL